MSSLFKNVFALPKQGRPPVPTTRPTQNTDPCDFQTLVERWKNGLGRNQRLKNFLEVILNQTALLKHGLLLKYLTLSWNVVGGILVIVAAYAARSVALAGFGLDSAYSRSCRSFFRMLYLAADSHREANSAVQRENSNG